MKYGILILTFVFIVLLIWLLVMYKNDYKSNEERILKIKEKLENINKGEKDDEKE